jgi:hypothetical protein
LTPCTLRAPEAQGGTWRSIPPNASPARGGGRGGSAPRRAERGTGRRAGCAGGAGGGRGGARFALRFVFRLAARDRATKASRLWLALVRGGALSWWGFVVGRGGGCWRPEAALERGELRCAEAPALGVVARAYRRAARRACDSPTRRGRRGAERLPHVGAARSARWGGSGVARARGTAVESLHWRAAPGGRALSRYSLYRWDRAVGRCTALRGYQSRRWLGAWWLPRRGGM